MNQKTTQVEARQDTETDALIRSGGVRRIHKGWYTIAYRGVVLERGLVISARRNPRGKIKWEAA
jgi:hypothetical protein